MKGSLHEMLLWKRMPTLRIERNKTMIERPDKEYKTWITPLNPWVLAGVLGFLSLAFMFFLVAIILIEWKP